MKNRLELTIPVSLKMMEYLSEIVRMEGFGATEGDVARGFLWDRINELIEARRLKER
jgi:hypothetical protein